MSDTNEAKPAINVTPLIDVLLVLLIIFMVVSPMKPSSFKAKIPQELKSQKNEVEHIHTLVVTIHSNSTLSINKEADYGTVSDPQKLIAKLSETFKLRLENRSYAEGKETRTDLSDAERIEKTVFIKAPRNLPYGEVAKIVDAVKLAGASPISLQIDGLN